MVSYGTVVLNWGRLCSLLPCRSSDNVWKYFRCYRKGYYWHLVAEARDVAHHSPLHRTAPPQQRTIRPSMYTLSRPGNPAVEWDRNMHPKGTSWLQVFKGAFKGNDYL